MPSWWTGSISPATTTPSTHRNLRKAEFPAAPPRIHWILAGWSRLPKAVARLLSRFCLNCRQFRSQKLQSSDFSTAVAPMRKTQARPARTNPTDSSPVLPAAAKHCSAAGASSKISCVVAVHAYAPKTLRLRAGFGSATLGTAGSASAGRACACAAARLLCRPRLKSERVLTLSRSLGVY